MVLRRLVTVPGYFVAWALWLAASPLWLVATALVDAVRRSGGVALRCAMLVAVYLTCEVLGILASAGLWAWGLLPGTDSRRYEDIHFRLEAWWGTTLFRWVVRLFGLRVEVEGHDEAELGRGPYLLLVRHSSTADTLLASALISGPHRMRLRYVLKRELLWDPCLDIVGNRLPNVFIDRFTADPVREVRLVEQLARDLGPRDGILIYPEGTRFSEAKRIRALERFRDKGDTAMVEYATGLTRVLPPRPGGTLGLLEAAPQADVVLCAHTGFEGAASLLEIWNGALLNRVVRVDFRRVARERIPASRDDRAAWLLEEWQRVGDWVEIHRHRDSA